VRKAMQGCFFSQYLFNLYGDTIIAGLTLDNLRHADDTTLVAILSVNFALVNSETWFLMKAERQTTAA
jgi:hypothetical protein